MKPDYPEAHNNLGSILRGMGARYIDGVFFNVFAVFSIGYLANTIGVPRRTMHGCTLCSRP